MRILLLPDACVLRDLRTEERVISIGRRLAHTVFDGTALLGVELLKIGRGHRACESLGWRHYARNHVPCSFATDKSVLS
jgi:hypothetical protein